MNSVSPRPSAATHVAGASANLQGMLMMALATTFLASMHAMVRHVSADLHPFEIAFFRNLFGLMVMLPWLIRAGRAGLVSRQPGLQALRAMVVLVAMLSWFYGLSVVPIAQATALSFTAAIFGSLGAVLFLGERMRLRRWTAVLIGFAGTLLILRPGWAAVDTGVLIVLLAAVSWGASVVIIKVLARTDSSITIVAWVTIALTVLSLPAALMFWTWPTPTQLGWLILIGALGSAGHLSMTQALKLSDEATAVLPVDYIRLVWTSLIGYLAFAEVPDIWVWVGGSTIFASTVYIAYREAKVTGARPAADKTQILG